VSARGHASGARCSLVQKRPSVIVALATPFDANGRVDLEALRAHVEFLCEEAVDALMPAGTTGEGALLDHEEVESLVAATVEASEGRANVLAHVGRPGTRETADLARRAVAAGASAVSAVVPYYYALGDEQIVRHYRHLIDAAGADVYAYTIPARTGNDLSVSALAALAADGLAGLKDSTKSFERHLDYLTVGIPVVIGSDGMVLDALAAGAAGTVSAIANVRPDLLVRLRDTIVAGRSEEAAAAQAEVSRLREELQRESPLVALKRSVGRRIDGYRPDVRAPLG
jgi:4-hydroxy-tetrahydrodipicolinate synthase